MKVVLSQCGQNKTQMETPRDVSPVPANTYANIQFLAMKILRHLFESKA